MQSSTKLKKVNTILLWVIRITIVITAIIMLIQQQYYEVKILSGTLVVTFYAWIIQKILKIEIPTVLQISLNLFIFGAQYLGTVMNWYGMFYWWDTLLHTISGGLFFFVGIFLLEKLRNTTMQDTILSLSILILFGICFSLSIGVMWEIVEFIADSFFGANMQRAIGEIGKEAIKDTMIDLSVATIGSIFTGITYGIIKKKRLKKKRLKNK